MNTPHQLISLITLASLSKHPVAGCGFPARIEVEDGQTPPDPNIEIPQRPFGPQKPQPNPLAYVPIHPRPQSPADYNSSSHKVVEENTVDKRGWEIIPLTQAELDARAFVPVPFELDNWRVKAVLDLKTMEAQAADPEAPSMIVQVENYIATIANAATKVIVSRAWHGDGMVQRQSPTVTALMAVLNLTDAQVDDMFRLGATFNP